MGVLDPGTICDVYMGQGHWGPALVLDGSRPDGCLRMLLIDTNTESWVSPSGSRPHRFDRCWQINGTCSQIDPEVFHPDAGGDDRTARALCRRCPAQTDCLIFALAQPSLSGIWGGTSEVKRRRIRTQARAERKASA